MESFFGDRMFVFQIILEHRTCDLAATAATWANPSGCGIKKFIKGVTTVFKGFFYGLFVDIIAFANNRGFFFVIQATSRKMGNGPISF